MSHLHKREVINETTRWRCAMCNVQPMLKVKFGVLFDKRNMKQFLNNPLSEPGYYIQYRFPKCKFELHKKYNGNSSKHRYHVQLFE